MVALAIDVNEVPSLSFNWQLITSLFGDWLYKLFSLGSDNSFNSFSGEGHLLNPFGETIENYLTEEFDPGSD